MNNPQARRYELLFNVRRSRRYHLWRVRLMQRLNAFRMLLFLASTSSVVAGLFAGWADHYVKLLGAVSVLFASAEMVLRLGTRELQHRSFARQYVSLERDIVAKGHTLTDGDLDELEAAYLDIEIDEPPVLRMLNRLCHNEQIQADHGADAFKYLRPVPWIVAWWARFWYQIPVMDRASTKVAADSN